MISKSDVIIKMQSIIEDFDFEASYQTCVNKNDQFRENIKKSEIGKSDDNPKDCIENTEDVYHGLITHRSRIYNISNKQFNCTVAYYSKEDKILNPKLIMRFDCHKINDL